MRLQDVDEYDDPADLRKQINLRMGVNNAMAEILVDLIVQDRKNSELLAHYMGVVDQLTARPPTEADFASDREFFDQVDAAAMCGVPEPDGQGATCSYPRDHEGLHVWDVTDAVVGEAS